MPMMSTRSENPIVGRRANGEKLTTLDSKEHDVSVEYADHGLAERRTRLARPRRASVMGDL